MELLVKGENPNPTLHSVPPFVLTRTVKLSVQGFGELLELNLFVNKRVLVPLRSEKQTLTLLLAKYLHLASLI